MKHCSIIPEVDSTYTCLKILTLDSSLKKNDSYYPQVFLKECRYNEKKVVSHIHVYFSNFSYSFDESDKE